VKKCNRANKRSYLKDLKGTFFYERAFFTTSIKIGSRGSIKEKVIIKIKPIPLRKGMTDSRWPTNK
ncbi:hypothetical protein P8881_22830, partial [Bacillus haynesii]|nr:hypothetical protein [Bacillus haynesii]